MKTLFRCDITVEEETLEHLWGMLALRITFGWEEESLATGETRVSIHCESRDFLEELMQEVRHKIPSAVMHLTNVDNKDWTLAWRQFFTPITCGKRFLVLPPWLQEETAAEGKQVVVIDPKSAFGTGHHATTALCLSVLSELLDAERLTKGMEFFDVGTGSGILGIACCLSGLYGVGVDIDKPSLENVHENTALNHILVYDAAEKQGFDVQLGSVEIAQGRTFDVVFANILARPLQEMAENIAACVKPNGVLILSGLLDIQAEDVIAAYKATKTLAHFPPPTIKKDGDWVALVFDNTPVYQ